MPQTATIKSLPAAFRMMKAMQAEDIEGGEDYRGAARQALAELALIAPDDPRVADIVRKRAGLNSRDR